METRQGNDLDNILQVDFDVEMMVNSNQKFFERQFNFFDMPEEGEEDGLLIIIKLSHDQNNHSFNPVIRQIYNLNSQFPDGMLTEFSILEKFDLTSQDLPGYINTQSDQIEGNEMLNITFKLPHCYPDHLLTVLSIIDDALGVLENAGVSAGFKTFDIIEKIHKQCQAHGYPCKCAIMARQLLSHMTANPDLPVQDVILLRYCFNALSGLTLPPETNLKNLYNEMFNLIDNLFIIASKKRPLLTKEAFHHAIDVFLNRINLWQRIRLYRPCLGKMTSHSDSYQWLSLEWDCLRDAQFTPDTKGIMHIELSSYLEEMEIILKAKILDCCKSLLVILAPHLNLSFPEDSKWDGRRLAFTPESSRLLLDMHLHHNFSNMKKLFKAKNNYRFFEEASKTGVLKENLHKELIEIIYTMAFGPMLSPQGFPRPANQGNVLQ